MDVPIITGVSDAVSWISLLIAILSAGFTWVNLRDRRTSERTAHIARMTLEEVEQRDDVADYSWTSLGSEIVIRNDGPSAITIGNVALAYGLKAVVDEKQPVYWELDIVPPGRLPYRLLPPGEQLAVEAPNKERPGTDALGPVVTAVDANGREWQRAEWGWRELANHSHLGWPRRYVWFERQKWWPKLDRALYERGAKKAMRRPRRVPWEIHLIDLAWGYRAGRNDPACVPWNAPRTWYYTDLLPSGRSADDDDSRG